MNHTPTPLIFTMLVGLHLEETGFRLDKYLSRKTFPDCNRIANSALTTQSNKEMNDTVETYVSAVNGKAISAGCVCHSVSLMLNHGAQAFGTNGFVPSGSSGLSILYPSLQVMPWTLFVKLERDYVL